MTASYWDTSTSGRTVGAAGRTTAALQSPTGYTGIYSQWNVDLDGDSTVDDPWHFGTTVQYPALAVDVNGAGGATWQELGYQLRGGPTLTLTADGRPVALSWTAVVASAWSPAPEVTSPRPEPAQSFVDRVMVDGEAPRNRADADAAVMQRGNLGRDDLVNRRLDRLGELSLNQNLGNGAKPLGSRPPLVAAT